MRHCDDETLAAIALGEPAESRDAAHVSECATCAAEVASLRETVAAVSGASGTTLVRPPERVWDAIRAEVEAHEGREAGFAGVAGEAGGHAGDGATVLTLDRRGRGSAPASRRGSSRLFHPWVVAVAAASGIVLGAIGVGVLGPWTEPAATVVAQAELADLATEAAAGEARVERRADGTQVLVVETPYTATDAGALEVWLIDPDVVGMVSLGFLTGERGEFEIPEGYDVGAFPIVDISIEPPDGDPTHSGDSITRGILG